MGVTPPGLVGPSQLTGHLAPLGLASAIRLQPRGVPVPRHNLWWHNRCIGLVWSIMMGARRQTVGPSASAVHCRRDCWAGEEAASLLPRMLASLSALGVRGSLWNCLRSRNLSKTPGKHEDGLECAVGNLQSRNRGLRVLWGRPEGAGPLGERLRAIPLTPCGPPPPLAPCGPPPPLVKNRIMA